jgi:hypothetical protein
VSPQPSEHWIKEGEKLLRDRRWHDGLTWARAVEGFIPPGVAQRFAEDVRASAAARAAGVSKDEAPARKRPLPLAAQVASGKRQMVVRHIHGRVRMGLIEVDPWPLPRRAWREGGWQVRLAPRRYSPNELEVKYRISSQRIRDLILFEPALPHVVKGITLTITERELPELERRIAVYRQQAGMRRRAAARKRWAAEAERAAGQERTRIPISVLARESHIDPKRGRELVAANPDLGWIVEGRSIFLPVSSLPEWERVVEAYRKEHPRSASGLRAVQTRHAQGGSA